MAENREASVQALIESLKTRFPTKGFQIHPAFSFCSSKTAVGLGAIAKANIKKNEVLLVIPESTRLSTSTVFFQTKELQKLCKIIEQKCAQLEGQAIASDEFPLPVAVMHVLSKKQKGVLLEDPYVIQASTWPSEDDMKETSMYYWDKSKILSIWNKSLPAVQFSRRRENLRQVFEEVIFPLLKNHCSDFTDTSLAGNGEAPSKDVDCTSLTECTEDLSKKDALWNTFVYAFSLVWSRAHASPDPELVPLVDLFNGNSDVVNRSEKPGKQSDKTIINVNLVRGKWPFLYGDVFRDDCNLPCSAVYANRDIDQGEELIISYGDLSPLNFANKYGSIPMNLMSHHDMQTDVSLWCGPSLISTDHPLRLQCLRKNGYPLEQLKSNRVALCELSLEDSVEMYLQNGYEPEPLKSTRQMLILSMLASDEELQRNFATGRLRGMLYTAEVLPLMCQIVDYNLEMLAPGTNATSAQDVERATQPDTPSWEAAALLARAAYRESLVRWRHAIARQGIPSHVDDKAHGGHPCLVGGGCNLCGRTYPSLTCGRCKKVKYCSRGHQRLDWKHHKRLCSTPDGNENID